MEIVYSNPYRADKNIGKAYNDFLQLVTHGIEADPEKYTWICIQDGDILYLTPRWGEQIEATIKGSGADFDLIGCYTNRVGIKNHLYNGIFSDDHDIKKHIDTAQELEKNNWAQVIETTTVIPGYFMLFKWATWYQVGGFKENTLAADRYFTDDVLKMGGRCGIMTGLYVYHAYRPHREGRTPAQLYTRHLQNNYK